MIGHYSKGYKICSRYQAKKQSLVYNRHINGSFTCNCSDQSVVVGRASNAKLGKFGNFDHEYDSPRQLPKRQGKYRRIMLKVSGEALAGPNGFGVNSEILSALAGEIKQVWQLGVQVTVVVGGGNYVRGEQLSEQGVERATADYVGMLATVMNSVCLQEALERQGVETRVQSALEIKQVCEPYIRRRAVRHLEKGRVVIFGAGTGNPFFTTDTAAALRAQEVGAEVFIKATKVPGLYTSDPSKNNDAKLLRHVTYDFVVKNQLKAMDLTAITFCEAHSMPVVLFNMTEAGNTYNVCMGGDIGSKIDCNGGAQQQGQQKQVEGEGEVQVG